MKSLLIVPLTLLFLIPLKIRASSNYQTNTACESFAQGNLDALKTLEALELNIDDYSIGINNTAKLFCA